MKLAGKDEERISTAGEVQVSDFGYYGDNIRGEATKLWLKPYDTPEFPLRAVTLFDYEDCRGHSIVLFEDADGGVKEYDNDALYQLRNEQVQTDSVIVPDGLRLRIFRKDKYSGGWDTTSVTVGTKEHKCVALEDAGSNSDEWHVRV